MDLVEVEEEGLVAAVEDLVVAKEEVAKEEAKGVAKVEVAKGEAKEEVVKDEAVVQEDIENFSGWQFR
ncbi:hypothetical protein SUGI_0368760 [Cryptomeria japonica]|nr:hypothetical protein SUGI_0368760 [Cryptomeria japonica]